MVQQPTEVADGKEDGSGAEIARNASEVGPFSLVYEGCFQDERFWPDLLADTMIFEVKGDEDRLCSTVVYNHFNQNTPAVWSADLGGLMLSFVSGERSWCQLRDSWPRVADKTEQIHAVIDRPV